MLWAAAWPLFRLSPRPLFGWRRWLLRRFGAQIGSNVHIYPNVSITIPWNLRVDDGAAVGEGVLIYCLGPVHIGAQATVSHRAHLCAGSHDYLDPALPLMRASITIGSQAWVCADAFVGPGVVVGDGAVVAAASVAMRDVPAWSVVAGNPAVVVKQRVMRSEHDR